MNEDCSCLDNTKNNESLQRYAVDDSKNACLDERMKHAVINQAAELLSPREACALLPGVGYQALLRWARQGDVAHVRLPNGRIYFRRADIEVLLTPVGCGVSAESVGRAPVGVGGVE